MNQSTLWHDTIFDALGTAVQAAGGTKRVAGRLWPTLDASSATARLRSSLNADHPQKLDPQEFVAIALMGKEAGEDCVIEFLARELGYEVKALTAAEARKNAIRARRLAILDELRALELEDDE